MRPLGRVSEETAALRPALMPAVRFPDGDYHVDSSHIIAALEERHPGGRSVLPDQPALAFLAELIEDLADEWLTKPMFHYRWHHAEDREHAGRFLAFTSNTALAGETADKAARAFDSSPPRHPAFDLYDTMGGKLYRRDGLDLTLIRDFTDMTFEPIRAPYDWRDDETTTPAAKPWHPLNDEEPR